MDQRIKELAKNLIGYSTNLQKGEKILIEMYDEALPLTTALIEEVYRVGGIPFVTVKNNKILRQLLKGATVEQLKMIAQWEAARMNSMDAYLGIRAAENISELSDVPSEQIQLYQKYWSKVVHSDIRVPNTKWCVLRYPNNSMAQLSNTSLEAFEDFYFNVYAETIFVKNKHYNIIKFNHKANGDYIFSEILMELNGYPLIWFNKEEIDEYFITLAEFRENRINKILE